jgi:hypothetical protein
MSRKQNVGQYHNTKIGDKFFESGKFQIFRNNLEYTNRIHEKIKSRLTQGVPAVIW